MPFREFFAVYSTERSNVCTHYKHYRLFLKAMRTKNITAMANIAIGFHFNHFTRIKHIHVAKCGADSTSEIVVFYQKLDYI